MRCALELRRQGYERSVRLVSAEATAPYDRTLVSNDLLSGDAVDDQRTAQRFVDETQAGVIHVNSTTTGAEVHVPFGGIKASGWGPHEKGRAAMELYTESVTVDQDL